MHPLIHRIHKVLTGTCTGASISKYSSQHMNSLTFQDVVNNDSLSIITLSTIENNDSLSIIPLSTIHKTHFKNHEAQKCW